MSAADHTIAHGQFSAAASPLPTAGDVTVQKSVLLKSFMVILVSEIGDKTFFIAAVMAMKSPRSLIFSAAIAALLVMTVLSAFMGHVVPQLISKRYTQLV